MAPKFWSAIDVMENQHSILTRSRCSTVNVISHWVVEEVGLPIVFDSKLDALNRGAVRRDELNLVLNLSKSTIPNHHWRAGDHYATEQAKYDEGEED